MFFYKIKYKAHLLVTASFLLGMLMLLQGCTKEEDDDIPANSYQDGVYFLVPYVDKISDDPPVVRLFKYNYSFYFLGDESIKQDTFWLPDVRITGTVASTDRDIDLVVADSGTTAIEGKHYRLIKNTVPANSYTAKVGVILLRDDNLGDSAVTLRLKLQPSAQFPGQIIGNSEAFDKSYYVGDTYTVSITNAAIEPAFWDVANGPSFYFYFWGKIKYEFITQTLGFFIGVSPNNTEEKLNLPAYVLKVKTAAQDYQDANNGEYLKDENGNDIYF